MRRSFSLKESQKKQKISYQVIFCRIAAVRPLMPAHIEVGRG